MGCTMAANKTAWGKLNETTQNVLREKAKEAAQFSFDCIAEDNVTARKTMEEGGVQFCDNPDIDSFKKKLGIPAYYTRYAKRRLKEIGLLLAQLRSKMPPAATTF